MKEVYAGPVPRKLQIAVLDHGFVRLRNLAGPTRRTHYWVDVFPETDEEKEEDPFGASGPVPRPFDADDVDPPNAARMSFDQADKDRPAEQDLKLARYLMKNWHTSPFEMIEVWLEMKLPIFVARQFVRHRTVSLNEVSGRYVQLPAEWYVPEVVGGKAPNKKQGQEDNLSQDEQAKFRSVLDARCKEGYRLYTDAIAAGVAPEHARMLLSLNHYTHWLWKQNLHNVMHFLSLRDHSHAQVEARAYAKAIDELLRHFLPATMALYDEYRRRP